MTRALRSVAVGLLLLPAMAAAQDAWTAEQRAVLAALERLSASTAPGGGGAEAYARVLADDFTRWTVGSTVMNDKASWIAGVREWFDAGWRVAARETEYLDIAVRGGYAFTRRIVREAYDGPDGENSASTAALAEVWIREGDDWLLLRVEARPMDRP